MISIPSRRCALPILLAFAAGASCSSAVLAQAAPAATPAPAARAVKDDTIGLTDEQRLAILDANTYESAARARGELPGGDIARRGIHGEVGVAVGSRGMHSVYGTADIPLGDNAQATVSFANTQYGRPR